MDERLLNAEQLFNDGSIKEALDVLNEILKGNIHNVDALLLRVKVYYRQQSWGNALNDLNSILEIDTDNLVARNYKTMVLDILTYWNKDNFNP